MRTSFEQNEFCKTKNNPRRDNTLNTVNCIQIRVRYYYQIARNLHLVFLRCTGFKQKYFYDVTPLIKYVLKRRRTSIINQAGRDVQAIDVGHLFRDVVLYYYYILWKKFRGELGLSSLVFSSTLLTKNFIQLSEYNFI